MNTESLKHHLAIKVMEWKATGGEGEVTLATEPYRLPSYYDPKTCEGKGFVKDYNPPENIEQAIECLEAIGNKREGIIHIFTDLRHSPEGYGCELYCRAGFIEISKKLSAAISNAVAKATGWKDD